MFCFIIRSHIVGLFIFFLLGGFHGSDWYYSLMGVSQPMVHLHNTRRVPVQRAVDRDEIPYPYKVHDTTLRPLLNITIKSTIVVRNRSRSCGGGDICGITPA